MQSLMTAKGVNAYEQGLGLLPDTKDNETILSLAKMTNNAYSDANKRDDWYDLGEKWGVVSLCSFPKYIEMLAHAWIHDHISSRLQPNSQFVFNGPFLTISN